MKFIKLNEWYYDMHCHSNLTKPLMCNADEISSFDVLDDSHDYMYGTTITMRNGTKHNVKEDFNYVFGKIEE